MNAAMENRMPTEAENGQYEGQATRLGTCGCPEKHPMSYYVESGKVCVQQTMELQLGGFGDLLGGLSGTGAMIGLGMVDEAGNMVIMMDDSTLGGYDPLAALFNPTEQEPRNLRNLFGLLGRNRRGSVPEGRFFNPDDPFAFLLGIGGNGPTWEQELDPDWQGESPDFLGMARRQNPPTDWSWLDELDPGSVDHLNRKPGQGSGNEPDPDNTDES